MFLNEFSKMKSAVAHLLNKYDGVIVTGINGVVSGLIIDTVYDRPDDFDETSVTPHTGTGQSEWFSWRSLPPCADVYSDPPNEVTKEYLAYDQFFGSPRDLATQAALISRYKGKVALIFVDEPGCVSRRHFSDKYGMLIRQLRIQASLFADVDDAAFDSGIFRMSPNGEVHVLTFELAPLLSESLADRLQRIGIKRKSVPNH